MVSLDALLLALPVLAVVSGTAAAPRGDPPPCSLNGKKTGGSCACDPGWVGAACERLNLLPANLSHGANWLTDGGAAAGNASFRSGGGTSSWGATQLRGDDGLWHTWVDEMKQNCGIDGYENNMQVGALPPQSFASQLLLCLLPSWLLLPPAALLPAAAAPLTLWRCLQIVHATSTERLGPWKREGPLHPFSSSSICAHALRDPASKKYLIFHTGCGNHSNPNSEVSRNI